MVTGNRSLFALNTTTGLLSLIAPLDHELAQSHTISVSASDNFPGAPGVSVVEVVINVTNDIDEPPVFSAATYSGALAEGDYLNEFLTTLSASDRDIGDILLFATAPPTTAVLSVDPTSGNVTVTGRLCFVEQSQFTSGVAVTDRAGLRDNATVTLSVRRINAHAPVFGAVQYVNQRVTEGNAVGMSIAGVSATDADCGDQPNLRYSIVGGDTSAFVLNATTGAITAAQVYDREQTAQLSIVVQVTDQGSPPRTNTVQVTVDIVDRNDVRPQFARTFFNLSIDEGSGAGREIAALSAADGDATAPNNVFTFAIANGNSASAFSLDSITGSLTLTRALCADQSPNFNLTITVTDQGTPSLQDSATVLVTINPVNQFDPEFPTALIRRTVLEGTATGTVLAQLNATDADCESNLVFTLDPSGADAFLTLDNANQ